MSFIQKYKWMLILAVLGGITGFSYYYFVGCASGTCAITSSPINSTIYGILMGGLLGDIFRTKKKVNSKD
jgi:phage shock protein E